MRCWCLRILTWLIGLLALGLATTVAVAWGLAAWLPHERLSLVRTRPPITRHFGPDPPIRVSHSGEISEYMRLGMCRRAIEINHNRGWMLPPGTHLRVSMRSPGNYIADQSWNEWDQSASSRIEQWGRLLREANALLDALEPTREAYDGTVLVEDARGFPRLALWCRLRGPATALAPAENLGSRGCLVISSPATFAADMRALPYLPIWSGLAFNTVFYAAAWGVVFAVPRGVRRIVRRARGRCLRCGYDLLGNLDAGCPECGWRREVAAAGTSKVTTGA